jgi:Trp operon repressor
VYDFAIPEQSVYQSGEKKGLPYTRNRWFTQEVSFKPRFNPIEGTEVKKTKDDPNAITRIYQTDEPTLLQLKSKNKEEIQLLSLLRQRSEKTKVVEMIESVEKLIETKNWTDGLIHGQYNQNVAITGRLSSSAPNLQNIPPELDQLLVSRYD